MLDTGHREQDPAGSVARARRSFRRWLLGQHFEETGFLYEQRRFLLDTDQLPWRELSDNEARCRRHLGALPLLDGAGEIDFEDFVDDTGTLHTAVCVYCRQGRFDALASLIEGVDMDDPTDAGAVADALKWEAPAEWQGRLLGLPSFCEGPGRSIAARVFGYRRWPIAPLLARSPDPLSKEMVWALGRSGDGVGLDRLHRALDAGDPSLARDAAVALLRKGVNGHLRDLSPVVDAHHYAVLPLGLMGHLPIQGRLEGLAAIAPSPEVLLAVGLLGRPTALELLIGYLPEPALGPHAAKALQLITGADLVETVFIPEPIEPEALTLAERERYERGEPVFETDGIPGETVTRVSRDVDQWADWLREHRERFRDDIPYRGGKPYGPESLADQLASPRAARDLRELAYDELVIRYRLEVPFDTDLLVTEQLRVIDRLRQWLGDHREVALRYSGAVSF